MTLDDRMKAAYQEQLRTSAESYGGAPTPEFGSTRRAVGKTLALVAAFVLVAVGLFSLVGSLRDTDAPPVELETATAAGHASNGNGDDGIDGADEQAVQAGDDPANLTHATATPTVEPSPTPTLTPTATSVPSRTPNATSSSAPSGLAEASATPELVDATTTPAAEAGTPTPSTPTPEPSSTPPADAPTATLTPVPTPPATATEPSATATAQPTPIPDPTVTPAPTVPPTVTVPPTPEPTATPAPSPTPEPTPTPSYALGVANTVCPSGLRAPLEQATLRYVGPNTGWGRLDDLVDEQDGPFYFEAWEPGYPNSVSVEVVLAQRVLAVDVRVAQDPFTPVEGTIDFTSSGGDFSIAISGVEGWRTHSFASAVEFDRFTITRDQELENIMEVLVCVAE